MITKHLNSAGQVVRASLAWGEKLPVIPLHELRQRDEFFYRLRETIPNLRLPPPPEVDPENPSLLREIKKAWCAAGRRTRKIVPARTKVLPDTRLSVVREAVSILRTKHVDPWTWSEFAQLENRSRYAPSMMRWYSPKSVRDYIDKCAEQKPPVRGWIIPLSSGTKLERLRAQVWEAIVANSHVSLDACREAADKVATEQEFTEWVRLASQDAAQELSRYQARIEAEEWVWPNW